VVIDAIRCLKLALDRGISGALEWPSAYFMKSPPIQHPDDEAHERVECFIRGGDRVAENGLPSLRDGEVHAPAPPAAG
jgi:myo-inositol-1-phosphate synthase